MRNLSEVREALYRAEVRIPIQRAIFDEETGRKISAFDVMELRAAGLSVEHAMWISMGIPLDTEPVRLRSVDGLRLEFK